MAVSDPEYDLPRGLSGAADVWDQPQASVLLAADYFPAAEPAGDVVTQSTRFDNPQTFFSATVAATRNLSQASRYDNAQTFFAGSVSQGGGGQSVSQNTRFDNAQTFPPATVSTLTQVAQASRFDNGQTFFAATVTTTRNVTAARYDNEQTFFGGSVVIAGGPQTISQAETFANQSQFFAGSVNNGDQPLADTHDGFWAREYRKMWERKPKKAEIVQAIEEAPEEVIEAVAEQIPQIKQEIRQEFGTIDYEAISNNVQMQRVIATLIANAIESRQLDEEEAEILLLM